MGYPYVMAGGTAPPRGQFGLRQVCSEVGGQMQPTGAGVTYPK
jgi:hypothetical protein